MQVDELKKHLRYLIEKYVASDAVKRKELLDLVDRDPVPVKGIFADLTPYMKGCSEADGRIIKDIAFNYI